MLVRNTVAFQQARRRYVPEDRKNSSQLPQILHTSREYEDTYARPVSTAARDGMMWCSILLGDISAARRASKVNWLILARGRQPASHPVGGGEACARGACYQAGSPSLLMLNSFFRNVSVVTSRGNENSAGVRWSARLHSVTSHKSVASIWSEVSASEVKWNSASACALLYTYITWEGKAFQN